LREYTWIGSRPPAERAKVAASLRIDAWVLQNRSRVTPRHLEANWQRYLDPPPAMPRQEDINRARRDEIRGQLNALVSKQRDEIAALDKTELSFEYDKEKILQRVHAERLRLEKSIPDDDVNPRRITRRQA
jgi:hypothetical protein